MRKILITLMILAFAIPMAFSEGVKENTSTRITVIRNGSLTMFTDDLGRTFNVPDGGFLDVIAGTPAAQNYIYAINPDRLIGISAEWPKEAERLVKKDYREAAVYGIFDYYADGLEYDAIKASGADAVLIVGDKGSNSSGITAILDEKQEETGVPMIFIQDNFANIPSTINRIALIISSYQMREEQNELAEEFLLPLYKTKNIVSYYYSASGDGLTPYVENDNETAVMEYMGMKNVVAANAEVPMTAEDIANANPDIILLTDETAFMNMTQTDEFNQVRAVQEGNIYVVPNAPYNILSADAGAGRLLGLQWMRMLAFKNLTMDNVVDDADDFFEDFYHSNLSDMEIKRMFSF